MLLCSTNMSTSIHFKQVDVAQVIMSAFLIPDAANRTQLKENKYTVVLQICKYGKDMRS